MIDLEELKRLYEFRDQAYMDGVAWRDAIAAAFPAIVAKLEALERGEFICKSCGHRKDADASKIDPPF